MKYIQIQKRLTFILLGASMLSGASVLGAALASWSGTDGIARLKSKKEQPPRPLLRSSGLDPVRKLIVHTYIQYQKPD